MASAIIGTVASVPVEATTSNIHHQAPRRRTRSDRAGRFRRGTESLPVVLEPATPAVVESPTVSLSHLTARERDVALARKALIDAVCNFETVGKSRRAAILLLVEAYRNGTLPRNLMEAARIANARRGASRGISTRALYNWYATYEDRGILGLVPADPKKDTSIRSGSRYSG